MAPEQRTNQEGRKSGNQGIHALRGYGVGRDELRAEEAVPRDIANSRARAASQASNFRMANLISIASALYNPTSIQMRKGIVLRRRLNSWAICSDWDTWCSEQASVGTPDKHDITHKRARDSDLLRDWKKGARQVLPRPTRKKKETPYRQNKGRARKQ